MSTPTTALSTTSATGPRRRMRRTGILSAAAIAGFALTLGTTTAPVQAAELVPQTESEAEQLIEDRAAEDPDALDRDSVPEGVSVE